MRKLLFLCIVSILYGCSSNSNEEEILQPKETKYKISNTTLVGVWQDQYDPGFFVSFSADKLFSAKFDENTIDDGDYTIYGDTILIDNSFLGGYLRIKILSASEKSIKADIYYLSIKDSNGTLQEKTRIVNLTKTDIPPVERNNQLIGKTISRNYIAGDAIYRFSVIRHNLMTYTYSKYPSNTLVYSGTTHYLYLPPKIYYTVYYDYGILVHYSQYVLNEKEVVVEGDGTVSFK